MLFYRWQVLVEGTEYIRGREALLAYQLDRADLGVAGDDMLDLFRGEPVDSRTISCVLTL